MTRILRRFADAVVESMDAPRTMDDFLAELDLKTISRDHDWRAIFSTVRGRDDEDSPQFKRAVLIKYLQYLSFRKRLLDYIHARKAGLEETDELSSELTRVPAAPGSRDGAVVRLGVAGVALEDFDRMPLGEAVEFSVGHDDVLEFPARPPSLRAGGRGASLRVGPQRRHLLREAWPEHRRPTPRERSRGGRQLR